MERVDRLYRITSARHEIAVEIVYVQSAILWCPYNRCSNTE